MAARLKQLSIEHIVSSEFQQGLGDTLVQILERGGEVIVDKTIPVNTPFSRSACYMAILQDNHLIQYEGDSIPGLFARMRLTANGVKIAQEIKKERAALAYESHLDTGTRTVSAYGGGDCGDGPNGKCCGVCYRNNSHS